MKNWERVDVDLATLGRTMRSAGFSIEQVEPVEGHAWRDPAGRFRRFHARYPDGWRVTLVMYLNGTATISYALRMRTEAA